MEIKIESLDDYIEVINRIDDINYYLSQEKYDGEYTDLCKAREEYEKEMFG